MSALDLSASSFLGRRRPPLAVSIEPEAGAFSPAQVAFAATSWTMRAEEEHHSAAIFADALSYLTDANVPLDALAAIARTVGDELRHAELCTRMARAFGVTPPANKPLARAALPATPAARRARGLEIIAMEGAVGETISCAVFLSAQRWAEEPATKAALASILRDEVLHARMSWEILRVVVPTLADEEKEALHRYVSWGLGAIEQTHMLPVLRRLERGDAFGGAGRARGGGAGAAGERVLRRAREARGAGARSARAGWRTRVARPVLLRKK